MPDKFSNLDPNSLEKYQPSFLDAIPVLNAFERYLRPTLLQSHLIWIKVAITQIPENSMLNLPAMHNHVIMSSQHIQLPHHLARISSSPLAEHTLEIVRHKPRYNWSQTSISSSTSRLAVASFRENHRILPNQRVLFHDLKHLFKTWYE